MPSLDYQLLICKTPQNSNQLIYQEEGVVLRSTASQFVESHLPISLLALSFEEIADKILEDEPCYTLDIPL